MKRAQRSELRRLLAAGLLPAQEYGMQQGLPVRMALTEIVSGLLSLAAFLMHNNLKMDRDNFMEAAEHASMEMPE